MGGSVSVYKPRGEPSGKREAYIIKVQAGPAVIPGQDTHETTYMYSREDGALGGVLPVNPDDRRWCLRVLRYPRLPLSPTATQQIGMVHEHIDRVFGRNS